MSLRNCTVTPDWQILLFSARFVASFTALFIRTFDTDVENRCLFWTYIHLRFYENLET